MSHIDDSGLGCGSLVTMRNGMFFAAGDDGQIRQVEEILRVEPGRDFEKCTRSNTIFHYDRHYPGFETHENFWNRRKFQVLMAPFKKNEDVLWSTGEVIEWEEYNMGPGDRFMKWKLHAKMIIDSSIPVGVGSLVYHPKNEGSSAAIITQVDQVDDKNKRMCTLASFGTGPVSSIKYELSELRPFDGTIKFHVRCMNVQGGGVLCHKHMGREAFSMKWLDPVTEKMDEPDGFHDGCWYFDPTQQLDPADLVDDQQVHQLRREFSEMIDKNETAALKELISKMLFEKLKERNTGGTWIIAPFQRVLLSVPFLIYTDIVLYFLECLQNKVAEGEIDDLLVYDGGLVVYSLVKVGVYLHHDKEWHSANSKLEAFITSQSDDPIEVLMDREIHKTINVAGEWFEDNEEFRAAVWCYSINLANLRNANVMSWLPTEERNHLLIDLLNYIALANKRMDNFVDAYKYYEEAIVMYNSMSSPRQTQPLIKNAKQMQTTAGAWFGTSATIPSWKSSEDVIAPNYCATCNAEGALKSCAACHLVCYCDVDCQREHWKKVHKHTCLGKHRLK